MAYNKNSAKASGLPGSSIKGAGSLPPGVYTGYFEIKKGGATFASMPAGLHSLSDEPEAALAAQSLDEGTQYAVRIALSAGCIVARTDGGRFYMADAATKAPLTGQHTEIHACLLEAAEKKLKLASPVVVEIKENDNVLFTR